MSLTVINVPKWIKRSELARELGISQVYLHNLITGKRTGKKASLQVERIKKLITKISAA